MRGVEATHMSQHRPRLHLIIFRMVGAMFSIVIAFLPSELTSEFVVVYIYINAVASTVNMKRILSEFVLWEQENIVSHFICPVVLPI